MNDNSVLEITLDIDHANCHQKASVLLAERSDLSQAKIKEAMQKGAVWLNRKQSKTRLRRATKQLKSGDTLQLNYNENILKCTVPEPTLISDTGDYSVWFKPFGLSCQGSRWGDHATINRWVENNISEITGSPKREVYLVHRLDRATTGLIILAHSKSTARYFSELFQSGGVDKHYRAIVKGDFSSFPKDYELKEPIDNKPSKSLMTFMGSNNECSLVLVKLLTGRKHQIRKHMQFLGFPILGDRLYGKGESDGVDLQLQSVFLGFKCPISNSYRAFEVPKQQLIGL